MHTALLSCMSSPTLYSLSTPFPPPDFALPPSTVSDSVSRGDGVVRGGDMASFGAVTWRRWAALSIAFGGGDVAVLGGFVDMVRGGDMAPLGSVVGVVGGR